MNLVGCEIIHYCSIKVGKDEFCKSHNVEISPPNKSKPFKQ